MLNVIILSVIMVNGVMVNVVMLSGIMLSVIMLNVVMLSVVAPYEEHEVFMNMVQAPRYLTFRVRDQPP
jgi:hypothetical protein